MRVDRILIFAAFATVVLALIVWLARSGKRGTLSNGSQTARENEPSAPKPVPPLRSADALNTSLAVSYSGSDSCRECHVEQFSSWQQTPHSRASTLVGDPSSEPPEGEFFHDVSGRFYSVVRREGRLRHLESFVDDEGRRIVMNDWPVDRVIGSGNHAKTYAFERNGFLHQSPITWYSSRQEWDLSPGYDRADHVGFQRPIEKECLYCHSTQTRASRGAVHRVEILEGSIGCESCHGPGQLHVETHQQHASVPAATRPDIVNPAALSRDRAESVCSLCHFQGEITVGLRGRDIAEFRPGLSIDDFRAEFGLDGQKSGMRVVGHVAQMRRSRCYEASEELTCTTCHDPHRPLPVAERPDWYRNRCLDCHVPADCGVPDADRRKTSPADDCSQCHMPRGSTDVPHVGFTDHFIRIPSSDAQKTPSDKSGGPHVISDVSHLGPADLDRMNGLAWLKWSMRAEGEVEWDSRRDTARGLLEAAALAGAGDPALYSSLALLWQGIDDERALACAALTMRSDERPFETNARVNALFASVEIHLRNGHASAALDTLDGLIERRNTPADWALRARASSQLGRSDIEFESLRRLVSLNPFDIAAQRRLGELYELRGDSLEAAAKRNFVSKIESWQRRLNLRHRTN